MGKVKNVGNCLKNSPSVALSFVLIFCSGLDNAVRIRDKMQVVYQEMARDGRKSNVAKMNLIGGIHIKLVKNCLMFI